MADGSNPGTATPKAPHRTTKRPPRFTREQTLERLERLEREGDEAAVVQDDRFRELVADGRCPADAWFIHDENHWRLDHPVCPWCVA